MDRGVSSLVDDDELALIVAQVNDMKTRLSLDSQRSEVDWGTLGVVYKENAAKLKEGLEFYGEGFKMLTTDIQVRYHRRVSFSFFLLYNMNICTRTRFTVCSMLGLFYSKPQLGIP